MLASLLELNTNPPLMSAHPHLGIALHLCLHSSGLRQGINPEKNTEITASSDKMKEAVLWGQSSAARERRGWNGWFSRRDYLCLSKLTVKLWHWCADIHVKQLNQLKYISYQSLYKLTCKYLDRRYLYLSISIIYIYISY